MRWYLKDAHGNVKNIHNGLINDEALYRQTISHQDGVVWSMGSPSAQGNERDLYKILRMTVDGSPDGGDAFDPTYYDLVCVISENGNGSLSNGLFFSEPLINIEYTFHFNTNYTFVHSKGAAGNDYIDGGNSSANQYSWNESTSSVEAATGDIRQNVHTVEYDIYVKQDGMALLELPFQDAWSTSDWTYPGNSNEPREYFRWYDWATDYAVSGTAGTLKPLYETAATFGSATLPDYALLKDRFIENGVSRGLMAWFPDREGYQRWGIFAGGDSWQNRYFIAPHKTTTAVTKFFRPSDSGWTGTDVACDVSRYRDGIDVESCVLEHEPTLSVRYIWHIHPAEEIAGSIKDALTVKADGLHPLEDGGTLLLGLNDGQAMANLHTELQDIDDYYFYEYNEDANTWGTTMYRAENLKWRVYTPDRQYYYDFWADEIEYYDNTSNNTKTQTNRKVYTAAELADDPIASQLATNHPDGMYTRFFKFVIGKNYAAEPNFKQDMNPSISWLSKVAFMPVSGSGATKEYNFKDGDKFPIIAYVTTNDKTKMAPVLRTDMLLKEGMQPILYKDLAQTPPAGKEELYQERNNNWLDSSLKHVGTITFDPPTGETKQGYTEVSLVDGNFAAPTNPVDNMYDKGLIPEAGRYGYCYPQLRNESQVFTYAGITPFHGEYGLFKAKSGTSFDPDVNSSAQHLVGENDLTTQTYYCWYTGGELRDRTCVETNGAKNGYFLYVDASDESRAITSIPFSATLCAGSSIVVTAAVANMTPHVYLGEPKKLAASPQILFKLYGINQSGQKKLLESFTTGDFNSVGADKSVEWYQVYAKTVLSAEVADEYKNYELEVNNYCDNTDGADYAIDDVCVYVSTAKVKLKQVSSPCDEGAGVEVKIVSEAKNLIDMLPSNTESKLYYRIFEKHDDMSVDVDEREALMGDGLYPGTVNNNRYGTIVFNPTYDESSLPIGELPANVTTGYYKGLDDVVYFQLDERVFPLEDGKTYFVSFFTIGLDAAGAHHIYDWGNPYRNNICSAYSNYIKPELLRIDLESGSEVSDGNIRLTCGATSVTKNFNITVQYPTDDGYVAYDDVHFDFYDGSKADFKAVTNAAGTLYLERALDHFRMNYPNYKTSDGELPTDYKTTETGVSGFDYTQDMHDLIQTYVSNGKLMLLATTQYYHVFSGTGEQRYAAIPVTRHVAVDRTICSPLEFVFNVMTSFDAPTIELGFDDVNYPANYKRVVRVGLEQLKNMKDGGFKLHIPVSNYKNKGADYSIGNKIFFSNPVLTLSATDDPSIDLTSVQPKVATIYDPGISGETVGVYVNLRRMYLPLDFSECEVTFHEGYTYEVSTSFYDEVESSTNEADRCTGDLFFVLKVVPEFVTWDARKISDEDEVYSSNWDDDLNWKRSVRSDLYKDASGTGAQQNTATAAHLNGYDNNGEGSLADLTAGSDPGFVPMKFTYVTMLGGNHSPSLFNESSGGKITGSPQTGGDLINYVNEMGTDTSPSGGSSYPTNDIKYDMVVRYGDHADGGKGCFGHRYVTGTDSDGKPIWGNDWHAGYSSLTDVYDVEKFYGNVCKEIYFKPHAELRLQQRLTYEKAWVEAELKPNQWYLMSVPLKGTYAGDMYVPESMTDVSLATPATVKGRQVTEAFLPITFGDGTGLYSRTKYPIYQRSWGLNDTKVYTKSNDVRMTDYSASIKYNSVSADFIDWSHTYNDVQVPYNNYSSFAIRANRKTMTDYALIRLPKSDTSYDYYQWDNTSPTVGKLTQNVTKGEAYGKLVYDINTTISTSDGPVVSDEWSIPLANLQAQGTDDDGYTYYLVGNPFMASIDMGKFFGYLDDRDIYNPVYYDYNPKLAKVYYVYDETTGVMKAVDAATEAGVIRPLQAFIVKCKASEAPTSIVFNRWAITDGNYTPATKYAPEPSDDGNNTSGGEPNPARHRTLILKASNGWNGSTANVEVREHSSVGYDVNEDASILFDSNFSDVPMVYTVAGNRAVSIDVRPDIDVVPFGVACPASNEMVTLTIKNSQDFSVLYVIDAVTGSVTEVGEGSTIMVQPNDYGRYFLTTNGDATGLKAAGVAGIMVSVRGKQITVKSDSPLQNVRILTIGGAVVFEESNCGSEVSFAVDDGVYIINAETDNDRKTVKLMAK